jgi:predicted AAA+ superfamily ATPase
LDIRDRFTNYLTFGGTGRILDYIDNKEQIKKHLLIMSQDCIQKDLLKRYKIKKTDVFLKIVNYLFSINANVFSVMKIEEYFKKVLKTEITKITITNYLR